MARTVREGGGRSALAYSGFGSNARGAPVMVASAGGLSPRPSRQKNYSSSDAGAVVVKAGYGPRKRSPTAERRR